jgi:hypothetical protein
MLPSAMPNPSAAETRLAWAVRAWEAEEENARRLAIRANLVLSVALAFAGFGTTQWLEAAKQLPRTALATTLLVVGGAGIVLVFSAFVGVLLKRAAIPSLKAPLIASGSLLPPGSSLELITDDNAMLVAAYRTTAAAAADLNARNIEERERLRKTQFALIGGTVLLLLCAAAYTVAREAPAQAKCCCCSSPPPGKP